MANDKQIKVKVLIDDEEYGMDVISKLLTKKTIYTNDYVTGNANAGQVELTVRKDVSRCSKAAPIKIYVMEEGTYSWVQKGVYFINERSIDRDNNICEIHGYDALFRANAPYKTELYNQSGNTTSIVNAHDVLVEIAENLDIELDSSTNVIRDRFDIEENTTYAEALGKLAAYNCGNFTINDEGKLAFVTQYLADYSNLLINEEGNYITFGGTRILLS